MRVDRKVCHVKIGDEVIQCALRGALFMDETRGETRPVAVGDWVAASRSADGQGAIERVLPRSSTLERAASRPGHVQVLAANVDQVLIVVSLRRPTLRPTLVDRFLVAVELSDLDAVLVVNKIDLCEPGELEAFTAPFRALGYPVLETSATDGAGIEALRERLRDRTSVVLGHSGVGKSSLLNAADAALALPVGDVTRREGKGRHTTTYSVLLPVAGGTVVDGPGIREFGLAPGDALQLAHGFREFRPFLRQCHFSTCTHTHEPKCAVKGAVESGEISATRYDVYVKLLAEWEGGGERMARSDAY